MNSPTAVIYARENQQRFLSELKELLRIPSVSTLPEHKADVLRAVGRLDPDGRFTNAYLQRVLGR